MCKVGVRTMSLWEKQQPLVRVFCGSGPSRWDAQKKDQSWASKKQPLFPSRTTQEMGGGAVGLVGLGTEMAGTSINWSVQEDIVSTQLLSTGFQGSWKVRFGKCGSGWPMTVVILVPKSPGSDRQQETMQKQLSLRGFPHQRWKQGSTQRRRAHAVHHRPSRSTQVCVSHPRAHSANTRAPTPWHTPKNVNR